MSKVGTFELMRVWAALTGVALVLWWLVEVCLGIAASDMIPMLVTAIGGFELVLFGQDVLIRRRREHG